MDNSLLAKMVLLNGMLLTSGTVTAQATESPRPNIVLIMPDDMGYPDLGCYGGEILHDTLYWEHEGGRAIRVGDWKMSSLPGKKWELFNLAEDHTEMNDLSEKYPQRVEMMNHAWEEWAKKMNVKIRKTN